MSWLTDLNNSMMSLFQGPSNEWKTPIDPAAYNQLFLPMTNQTAGQLFGTPGTPATPGQTTYANPLLGLFGLGGSTTTPGTPGTPGTLGSFGGASPNWVYQGPRTAGYSPLQQQTFNWAGTIPDQTSYYQNLGLNAANAAAQPMNYDALLGNAANLWNRTIMPSVMNRQSGMDAASSGGTADALARAGGDLSSNLFAQMAPLELQARQQQLAAANQFQSLGQMPLEAMKYMDLFGTQQRDIMQQGLTGEQQRFTESLPTNSPYMQLLSMLLQNGQQTAVQQPAGIGYSMLSGASQGLGAALPLLFL